MFQFRTKLMALVLLLGWGAETELSANAPIVAGYYDSSSQYRTPTRGRSVFSPSVINPNSFTDLYFCSVGFGNGKHQRIVISPLDSNFQDLFLQLRNLKQKNPALKIFVSVGGDRFNSSGLSTAGLFSKVMATKALRSQFATALINFAKKNNIDGIDIDWQTVGDSTAGGSSADFDNLKLFFQEAYPIFKSKSILLASTWNWNNTKYPNITPELEAPQLPTAYYSWLAIISNNSDRIQVLTTDLHSPFRETVTEPFAPINQIGKGDPVCVRRIVDSLISSGVPAKSLVITIANYSATYNLTVVSPPKPLTNIIPPFKFDSPGGAQPSTNKAGFISRYEFYDLLETSPVTFAAENESAITSYFYFANKGLWFSTNNINTISAYCSMSRSLGLGGLIFKSLDLSEYEKTPFKFYFESYVYNYFYNDLKLSHEDLLKADSDLLQGFDLESFSPVEDPTSSQETNQSEVDQNFFSKEIIS
jgi:GH18 family chitinase